MNGSAIFQNTLPTPRPTHTDTKQENVEQKVPGDRLLLWLNSSPSQVCQRQVSFFRLRGLIYLASFTLTCSAAASGNIFIFSMQNMNPAEF